MLLYQQGSRIEVAKPQIFREKIEEVSAFINVAQLYLRMKMTDEAATTQGLGYYHMCRERSQKHGKIICWMSWPRESQRWT